MIVIILFILILAAVSFYCIYLKRNKEKKLKAVSHRERLINPTIQVSKEWVASQTNKKLSIYWFVSKVVN